jgi:AbrB family looped-hinge helix DNA binding protein
MKKVATLSSKNQVTIPAEVRRALGLCAGEVIVFDVDEKAPALVVTLKRYPTLDEIAGSVPVPPEIAGLSWGEIRARAWAPTDESAVPSAETA